MSNYEDHREAKQNESTCKTCASFYGGNCQSVDSWVYQTHENMTCRYHLTLIAEITYNLEKETVTIVDKLNTTN